MQAQSCKWGAGRIVDSLKEDETHMKNSGTGDFNMTPVGSVSLLGRMLGRRHWYQRCSNGLYAEVRVRTGKADLKAGWLYLGDRSLPAHKTANICGVSICTVVALQKRVRDELGRQSTVQWKDGEKGNVCRAEPVSHVTAACLTDGETRRWLLKWAPAHLPTLPSWEIHLLPVSKHRGKSPDFPKSPKESSPRASRHTLRWRAWPGQLTTHPADSTVMKGHSHFEMPPKRPAWAGALRDVSTVLGFLQLWTLKADLPLWPLCL